MKKLLVILGLIGTLSFTMKPDWGFYGHKRINEIACYTLPQELLRFFKPNVEYIRNHAVDPDMRRYALKKEAGRHYIDIDHWGEYPYEELPRDWPTAMFKMMEISFVDQAMDTILLKKTGDLVPDSMNVVFFKKIRPFYFSDDWELTCDDLNRYFPEMNNCQEIIAVDSLTDMGILPYGLSYTYKQLVKAYADKNHRRILRHAADIGHYIGDAHVPLHTTVNYNGQLTDQVGIHAFWESRLPELFAEEEYDLFTGMATYIDDVDEYIWDVVLNTHTYVDSVLLIEKRLSQTFPDDQQFCFEERLNRTVKIECEEYAKAYHTAMDGMVERQMVKSIAAVGNIWYSAWVDAGQPDLQSEKLPSIEVVMDSVQLDYPINTGHH